MRIIRLAVLPIVMAIASPSANAQCPNLSGKYVVRGEAGQVHIVISTSASASISSINDYVGTMSTESHGLKLDGNEQKDSGWMGGTGEYRTSAKFVGSALQIRARAIAVLRKQ